MKTNPRPSGNRHLLSCLLVAGLLCMLVTHAGATSSTVTVDLSTSLGVATHRAAGILHSFSATEPPDSLVLPLRLRAFRGRATSTYLLQDGFYARLKRIGVEHVQVCISDNHGYPNGLFGWPGDDATAPWWFWESWVVPGAVNDCKNRGMTIEYDLWNEPDISYFWGRDQARWFETWRRGYIAVRAIDPQAVIVGPSISNFNATWLSQFLVYARDNNCVPSILSWHELGSSSGKSIPAHVQAAKDLITTVGVSISRFSTHEIIPNSRQYKPATAIAYFAGIERTNIESAMHSCWGDVVGDNGENASLDGMLTHDTKQPRSSWWAYEAYANLTGTLVDLTASTAPPSIDGLGSYDMATSAARIALGNYGGSNTADIVLQVKRLDLLPMLAGRPSIPVKAYRIPNTETGPLAAPVDALTTTIIPVANTLTVSLPALGYYEGMTIVLGDPIPLPTVTPTATYTPTPTATSTPTPTPTITPTATATNPPTGVSERKWPLYR